MSELIKIGELCEITSSKRIFAKEYKKSGVPFFRGKEITEKYHGKLNISSELFIAEEKFLELKSKFGVPQQGDLLLTSVGTLGSTYIVKPNDKFYFKDGNLTWFKNFKDLNSQYLKYWLESSEGKGELRKSEIGSSQAAYTIANLKEMKINLPPIDIQLAVVNFINQYDKLIENNNRRIAILEDMAQSLYREWFVHFRYPNHFNKGGKQKFIDSPLGKIPEGWQVKEISECYKTFSGGTPSRKNPDYYGDDHLWIKTKELKDGFVVSVDESISCLGLKKSSAKLFPRHSVVMAMYGATIGRLGILSGEASTNQACCALLPLKKEYSNWFAYLMLLNNRKRLISLGQGAAQQNISQAVIKSFKIITPSTEVLEVFNHSVEPFFLSIENLHKRNENLKKQRDMLLPKLISGDIKL